MTRNNIKQKEKEVLVIFTKDPIILNSEEKINTKRRFT